jgi:hypothetical protein
MGCVLAGLVALIGASPARADPFAVIGILQGSAQMVRQTARFTLVEGTALSEGDIVELAPGAFMQVEFDDGALLDVGESSRMILRPRLQNLKTMSAPQLYLLDGWIKLRTAPKSGSDFDILSPAFETSTRSAALVVRVQPKVISLFAESGNARMQHREGSRSLLDFRAGDFLTLLPGADKPTMSASLPADFLEQMPRSFRDPLPARASLYAGHNPQPKPMGPIDYPSVSAWMHSEAPVRLPLSKQWRSRASDSAFRAAVAANLAAHMEWERVLYPERFLPKKPAPPPPVPVPQPSPAASAESTVTAPAATTN